jgi:hypothetical protein
MAKRKAASRSGRGRKPAKRAPARKARPSKKPARRRVAKAAARKKPAPKRATVRPAARKAAEKRPVQVARPRAARRPEPVVHISRVERERRILEESVPTPPSSLNMDRRGTAARTGRAEIEEARENLGDMSTLTVGDVDANAENAYFSGDEAPGGDNPTPDQDVVDDIGRAMGLAYQDNEELRSGDKVADRDRHRWERDPASSEDYKDRK